MLKNSRERVGHGSLPAITLLLLASCAARHGVDESTAPAQPGAAMIGPQTKQGVTSPPPPMAGPPTGESLLNGPQTPAGTAPHVGLDVEREAAASSGLVNDRLVVHEVGTGTFRAARQIAPGIACCVPTFVPPVDREQYEHAGENPVKLAREEPVSTFSIDVDTGSYSNVRRFLNAGALPPEDAVRVEELINYFDYAYPAPGSQEAPFSVTTALASAPWNREKLLLQIGIKGFEVPAGQRAAANLVFLVDVSGSMNSADKLPLLKSSLRLLVRQLRHSDHVSLVAYAGAAGLVLAPTPGDHQAEILAALDRLEAGGSTNGAGGIRLAYEMAHQVFFKSGINRVLLATDGDFNVGTVNFEELIDLVERERASGVALTTLGFGTGNYNDKLLERLADAGNGNYAYIDTLNEGRKVLVEQMAGTLQTIAKDVKIQVEFNPAAVAEYRLIGYENRALRREDFNNDKIDAGEIGAGHTVTALYEIAPTGSSTQLIDPLRYGEPAPAEPRRSGELAWVRLRYKAPESDRSRLLERAILRADAHPFAQSPPELRFAASVAAFGQLLRGGKYTGDLRFADVAGMAREARGEDRYGYRSEFLGLVRLAESLSPDRRGQFHPED